MEQEISKEQNAIKYSATPKLTKRAIAQLNKIPLNRKLQIDIRAQKVFFSNQCWFIMLILDIYIYIGREVLGRENVIQQQKSSIYESYYCRRMEQSSRNN